MKHIALAIGPIIETLSLGRKTAEIWAASYFFSSFMKSVIDDLRKLDVKFIVSHIEDDLFKGRDNGIGLFHDRFILSTDTVMMNDVSKIIQKHKDSFADMIANSINEDQNKVKVRKYISQYFQTYLVELDDDFDNPILDISDILDSVELHLPCLESDKDYMRMFLNRDIVLNSDLAINAFEDEPSFVSIPDIASKAMGKKSDKEDEDFYKELEKDKDNFKQAYKYIAIVHADGDNLGSYIKNQDDPSVVSKRLLKFDNDAVKEIESFGATPIFVGGDDLLFFAPVLTKDETIFDLLDRLNKLFSSTMESDETTLSFGVSITYYKYPLYEALENSREALFEKAKKYPDPDNPTKNATHISVIKYSGQSFEVTISRDENSYETFRSLLKNVLIDDLELPHSIHHKLEEYKPLVFEIEKQRIASTFGNIFNEEIHQEKFKKGLEEIQKLLIDIKLDEKGFERLFALLSIIKLLRSDR